jgi:hypothetical protein
VRQVAEEATAERVVTQILDDRASVGIGMGLEQILRGRTRESFQEKRLNAVLPGSVDNRFMCENRITGTIGDVRKHQ